MKLSYDAPAFCGLPEASFRTEDILAVYPHMTEYERNVWSSFEIAFAAPRYTRPTYYVGDHGKINITYYIKLEKDSLFTLRFISSHQLRDDSEIDFKAEVLHHNLRDAIITTLVKTTIKTMTYKPYLSLEEKGISSGLEMADRLNRDLHQRYPTFMYLEPETELTVY